MARRAATRSQLALRWLGLVVLGAIAIAYVQPLRAYESARSEVERRQADVAALESEHRRLSARLQLARSDEFVVREARKLGLVRPGERLFIVSDTPP